MARSNPYQNSRSSKIPLGPQVLEENEKQFDYGFEFAVYKGPDSGYFSRETYDTEQAQDADHTSEDTSHPDAPAGLTSYAETVGPHVENHALFDIGDAYPAFVEDQDLTLMAYDAGSTFFDETMPGSEMHGRCSL